MKLTYTNSWEYHTYLVDGKEISGLTKVRILKKEYLVTSRPVSIEYWDHGHRGAGTSDHYFVKTKVFDKTFEFDLSDLIDRKITVQALKYELAKEQK